jgi:hypothetical protein
MRAKEHWEKAARLEASGAAGLDGDDDYELIIWSCVQGGAQLANAILCARGITADDEDQIHSDLPELKRELPPDVKEMLALLKSIENLGPRFVRGIEPMQPGVVKNCLEAYARIKAMAQQSLQVQEKTNARQA